MSTRPADLARGIKGTPAVPVEKEADHFERCPGCGQMVNRRDLADALQHFEPGHPPPPRQ